MVNNVKLPHGRNKKGKRKKLDASDGREQHDIWISESPKIFRIAHGTITHHLWVVYIGEIFSPKWSSTDSQQPFATTR